MSDIQITGVQLLDASGAVPAVFETARPIIVRLQYQTSRAVETPHFAVDVYRADGQYCAGINTRMDRRSFGTLEGRGHVDLVVDSRGLRAGGYVLSVGILDAYGGHPLDVHHRAYHFSIGAPASERGLDRLGRDWPHSERAADRALIKKELVR